MPRKTSVFQTPPSTHNTILEKKSPAQLAAGDEVRFSIVTGITNTPTFRVNGMIDKTVDEYTTYDQWVAYINSYLKQNVSE